jgi:hypothetical protein
MLAFRLLAVALTLGVATSAAIAQPHCGKRTELIRILDQTYHEASTGLGTINELAVIEVFTSQKGTFTILASQANGISCIIATGQNWEASELPKNMTAL